MIKKYNFQSKLWVYPGKAGWHFVTLPKKIATTIDFYFADSKRGWGSLKVEVRVGRTRWRTSIFPDKESSSYLLPIKAEVRKQEDLAAGQKIEITLEIIT